jgi:integrase
MAIVKTQDKPLVGYQRRVDLAVKGNLAKIGGPYRSVETFLRTCGPLTTKKQYTNAVMLYLRWLKEEKGIAMNPDDLMLDNLRCIYESAATDVATKRKHTNLLDEYINGYLLERGQSEAARMVKAAAIKGLYRTNDSHLFGNFSLTKQALAPPDRPLLAEDIRVVLKTLPMQCRAPLLCVWQGGIEVNRVLALRWKDVEEGLQRGEHPLRVELYGRKRHRRTYHTYLGRDAIEHLKLEKTRWRSLNGREPSSEDFIFTGKRRLKETQLNYEWLNCSFRRVAMELYEKGLIKNGRSESWHSHNLRHSFRTEAAHAGVKSEVSEFFLGHVGGIVYVYNHRDEVHPEDLAKEYLKIEPHVSLDYTETVLAEKFDEERRTWISEIAALRMEVARFAGSTSQAPQAAGGSKAGLP